MIPKTLRDKVIKRDGYCLHCGETDAIAINHRKNRGMGGRSSLDRLDNLIVICSWLNSKIEDSAYFAEEAKATGWKLEQWMDYSVPVFDACTGDWWVLDVMGTRTKAEEPNWIF